MTNTNYSIRTKTLNNPYQIKNKQLTQPSFCGHLGAEKYAKDGITWLRHETALFRDLQTKNFVKEYIIKNFKDKNEIKIIVGGCSTGEEAYTFSMLLKDIANKVKITGFDLSKESIKSAKSKKLLMQKQKETPNGNYDIMKFLKNALKDSYLCFTTTTPLTKEQTECKKLFDEFFEISSEIPPKEKESLSLKLKMMYFKYLLKIIPPEYESKYVVLKTDKAKNCRFVQGDILKLEEITKGEKADVITFSNAVYHIICDDSFAGFRVPKKNAEEIAMNIAKTVKENLSPKGIFVLGENEAMQTMDTIFVPQAFKRLGFRALNETKEHPANVWQLIE